MLRENLDAVLKDLLEFKGNDHINSIYPGPKLDLEDNFLLRLTTVPTERIMESQLTQNIEIVEDITKEVYNKSAMRAHRYDVDSNMDETIEHANRIRRYLDGKNNNLNQKNWQKYFQINKEKQKESRNRNRKSKRSLFHKKNSFNRNIRNNFSRELNSHRPKRLIRNIFEDTMQKQDKNNFEDPAHGDATLKARFLFKSCMNYDILHKRGHQPLLDLLDLLGGWPILKPDWNDTNFDWLELMAKLRLYNNDILLSEWVGPDIKNSDEFVIQFDQTSLGNTGYKKYKLQLFVYLL